MDIAALAAPGIRALQPYQPGKPVDELERELGIERAIKLASNENPLGPSPRAQAAVQKVLGELARYPDGNGYRLKQKIAEALQLTPAQVTLGNGSNDILELVARAFVTDANSVVYSQHAFAVYPLVTQAIGARGIEVAARDYGHDLEAIRAAIRPDTRLVFIANPNNPTGTWINDAALRGFLEQVPPEVLVVVDEAYNEYVLEPDYPHGHRWLDEFPNLVVTRTFSKAYGLAGLRVGYGVSSTAIADFLNRVRQPFNVNSAALAAAEAALEDADYLRQSRDRNAKGMRQLSAAFEEMGLDYIPSVGNFIAVDLRRNGREVYQALLRRGIIVRPVDNYGMPTFLRITIGLPEENAAFLDALRASL